MRPRLARAGRRRPVEARRGRGLHHLAREERPPRRHVRVRGRLTSWSAPARRRRPCPRRSPPIRRARAWRRWFPASRGGRATTPTSYCSKLRAQPLAQHGEELRLQRPDGHELPVGAFVGPVERRAPVEQVRLARLAPMPAREHRVDRAPSAPAPRPPSPRRPSDPCPNSAAPTERGQHAEDEEHRPPRIIRRKVHRRDAAAPSARSPPAPPSAPDNRYRAPPCCASGPSCPHPVMRP